MSVGVGRDRYSDPSRAARSNVSEQPGNAFCHSAPAPGTSFAIAAASSETSINAATESCGPAAATISTARSVAACRSSTVVTA